MVSYLKRVFGGAAVSLLRVDIWQLVHAGGQINLYVTPTDGLYLVHGHDGGGQTKGEKHNPKHTSLLCEVDRQQQQKLPQIPVTRERGRGDIISGEGQKRRLFLFSFSSYFSSYYFFQFN